MLASMAFHTLPIVYPLSLSNKMEEKRPNKRRPVENLRIESIDDDEDHKLENDGDYKGSSIDMLFDPLQVIDSILFGSSDRGHID